MSGQFRVTVNVFVDAKQRGKLSVSERLRSLLRQNERRNPQQQNQQRTNFHSEFKSTDFVDCIFCHVEQSQDIFGYYQTKRFLDFARNDRKFVSQWNLRRTRCSSARIPRRGLWPLSWAKGAPCVSMGGEQSVRAVT